MSARSFRNNVTLTLFEGNPIYAQVLTDVMRVQLDNTKQNLYICAKRASLKTVVALKPIFGKILLDKD